MLNSLTVLPVLVSMVSRSFGEHKLRTRTVTRVLRILYDRGMMINDTPNEVPPLPEGGRLDAPGPWHIQCLCCGHLYYYEQRLEVIHNKGYDWEDSSQYCPNCGLPNEAYDREYRMIDGLIP